ncbi:uncharacterized protein F4822DRAFT_177484 [Hypoxylon trugodes]|uniref:uncharacterized protein n=1 Tax=Hypoxylon trugodes TaxID=326681 RepID=UPI00218DA045|nr:uncharacterized protein F4822DRAFT_177484 [Hypoxylon trugodes]KAI1391207.1 hypothetical protein F4822DRAFT_177484 [Hypoxylon trugodes]
MLATRLATTVRTSAGAISRTRVTPPCVNSPIPKPSTIATSKFSTSRHTHSTKKPSNGPSKPSEEEIQPTPISFKDLGMTRTTKIVVLVLLSIYGTFETIFYINWFMRWWSGSEGDESETKA